MKETPWLMFVAGIVAGGALTVLLREPSSCCQRVAAGVRDHAPGWAQTLGDVLGAWQFTPGLIDLLGVS